MHVQVYPRRSRDPRDGRQCRHSCCAPKPRRRGGGHHEPASTQGQACIRELADEFGGPEPPRRSSTPTITWTTPTEIRRFAAGSRVLATDTTRSRISKPWTPAYWEGDGAEDTLPSETVVRNELRDLLIGGKTDSAAFIPGRGHTGGDLAVLFVEDRVLAHGRPLLPRAVIPSSIIQAGVDRLREWVNDPRSPARSRLRSRGSRPRSGDGSRGRTPRSFQPLHARSCGSPAKRPPMPRGTVPGSRTPRPRPPSSTRDAGFDVVSSSAAVHATRPQFRVRETV